MLYPPSNSSQISQAPRVVVTGAGIVTALGVGWRPNAEGFRQGRSAFRPVTLFDVSRQRVQTAAVADVPDEIPSSRVSKRAALRLDRSTRMLLWAAAEAWNQSGWTDGTDVPVVLGTTAGGMSFGEAYFRQAVTTPGSRRNQPARALHYQSQTQARTLCDAFHVRGPVTIVANACAAGANALGHAWELLRSGRATRAIAGGYDGLSQLVFAGFDALQALSLKGCRPFDADRDGLALGEGAAVMTLETLESATRRGASILAELAGYGTTIDLHHLTQPQPEGAAALATMREALRRAGIKVAQVDYINAHGTGTKLNDSAEAAAIQQLAGDQVANLRVSSTKAGIGHLLGAAGAVEAAVCIMALREQWLPPQAALETPDPLCTFQLVRRSANAPIDVAMTNSFGFGGVNATLVFRRCR